MSPASRNGNQNRFPHSEKHYTIPEGAEKLKRKSEIRNKNGKHVLLDTAFDTFQWFHDVIDQTIEGIFLVDENGIIIEWNNALENIFGLVKSEVIGQKIWDIHFSLLPKNQRTRKKYEYLTSRLQMFFEKGINPWFGQPQEGEYERPDGKRGFIRQLSFPIKTAKGFRLISFAHDITDTREVELELRKSERRYRALFDENNDGVFIMDLKGMFIQVNQRACEMFGYKADEIVRLSYHDTIAIDELSDSEARFQLLLQGAKLPIYERTFRRKDGTEFIGEINIALVLDNEGKPIHIQSIVRDVNKRREAVETLKQSEAKYRSLADHSLPGLVVMQDNHIVYANQAYATILGYTIDELTQMSVKEIWSFIHPDDQSRLKQRFKDFRAGKQQSPRKTYRIFRKDGKMRWVESFVSIIQYDGEPAMQAILMDITNQKEAEQALSDSEERYRRLYENLSDGLFMVDINGKIIFCSPRGAEIFGYTPKELIETSFSTLLHEDDISRITEMYEISIETQRIRNEGIEARGIRKDGKPFYFHATGLPVIKDGILIGYQSMVRDITERHCAETAVREERDKAQMYLDMASTIFLALDTQGTITMLNRKGCEILQYEHGEAIGKSWFDHIPKNLRDEVRSVFKKFMRGEIESKKYHERPIITNRGEERIIAWQTNVLKNDDGRIFGLLSSGTDITQEKRIMEALEDSESRYQTLIETTPDAIALTDLNSIIIMVNNGARSIVGYESEDDLVGKSVFEFLIPEEHEKARQALQNTIEGKGPIPMEFTLLRKNGGQIPVEIIASVVIDTHDNPTAFVIVARDVSQRKKTESELRYAKDQALVYLDILGHDIRNQLQAVLGSAEVAKGLTDQGNLKMILENIAEGATRCEQIISKIKATENLMSVELRPRNFCGVLKDCVEAYSCMFPGVDIEVKCNSMETIIDADDFLEILCHNLLENAVQHNPNNMKRIWITTKNGNDNITISIADNGTGVSDSRKKSLFDITRRFGGVGLHQVGEIVRKYGGHIEVVDRVPGQSEMGAEFRISLPKSKMSDE
jgi:PAS domain S-box-containing protein